MGPYGSDVEFAMTLFCYVMAFLLVVLVVEFIAERRDRD
jgi:hypothetical protein